MNKSETKAKPWSEEALRNYREAPEFEPSHPWSRWSATVQQRDEEIARLKAQESPSLSASREETSKSHHELAAWKALALSATERVERLEAAQRESDRVMTLEVEARREAEEELQRARALLGTADRAVESVESLREEIRTLKAQVRSADEASIAATRAKEQAENALRLSEINERSTEGERDLAMAESQRLRAELDEVTRGALEAQELAEARRKREVELEAHAEDLAQRSASFARQATEAQSRLRASEARVRELEAQVERHMVSEANRTLIEQQRVQQEQAMQGLQRDIHPWCPTHGHYGSQVTARGTCPLCPSLR